MSDYQALSGGGDQSVRDTPAERAGLKQAEELKDNIIDLVLSALMRGRATRNYA
jgi:hypothetical protein